jgi:hypothetical protein
MNSQKNLPIIFTLTEDTTATIVSSESSEYID